MGSSESGVVDALSRIAETFGKLVVQHLHLLRSELETEGRALATRGRALTLVLARAMPFVLAGIFLISLGVGVTLALLLEPLIGRAAWPCALVLLGGAETTAAVWWLKRQVLAQNGQQQTSAATPADSPPGGTLVGKTAAEGTPGQVPVVPPQRPPDVERNPVRAFTGKEEKLYGAVGRA